MHAASPSLKLATSKRARVIGQLLKLALVRKASDQPGLGLARRGVEKHCSARTDGCDARQADEIVLSGAAQRETRLGLGLELGL